VSTKINILVVEDEDIVAMDLCDSLQLEGYNVVSTVDNAADAIKVFSQQEVDLVLMDINIIGAMDGVTLSEKLLEQKKVPVIYLSAQTDPQTLERVKQTHPAAFLTKPFTIQSVCIAIEVAISNFASVKTGATITARDVQPETDNILQLNDVVFIKNNYRFEKILLSDIQYLEADNNYVNIITSNKKFALRLSLNAAMEKIHYQSLVRIHRSYAVNMKAIQSFNEHDVMIGKQEIPISRNYKEEFLKQFDFR